MSGAVTVETPPPRIVAAAIAELAAERVREAWRHIDAFEALATAGVPRADIRENLVEPFETEALAAMRDWLDAGERGLLAIVGNPGTGKGYAAGRWILDRHARGLFTTWLATETLPADFRARDAKLASYRELRALVIDDLGSGTTTGEALRDSLTGLIKNRVDQLRPTMLLTNGTAAEISTWLGPRVIDRQQVAGGFAPIEAKASLRAEATVKLDALGRGPEWYQAARIVALIGCEPVQRYDTEGRALPRDLDVGRTLDAAARMRGYDACKQARELLGLDAKIVLAKAQDLAIIEARQAEELSGTLGVTMTAMALNFEGVAAALADAMRAKAAERIEDDRKEVGVILDKARRGYESNRAADVGLGAFEDAQPPKWATGPDGRRKLQALGFRVKPAGESFAVYRDQGKCSERLADGCRTFDDGWRVAALLCAEVDTRKGGDAALHPAETGLRNAS